MGKQNCKIGGRGEWESLNYVLKSRGKRGIYAKKRDNRFNREGARKEMVKGTSRLYLT